MSTCLRGSLQWRLEEMRTQGDTEVWHLPYLQLIWGTDTAQAVPTADLTNHTRAQCVLGLFCKSRHLLERSVLFTFWVWRVFLFQTCKVRYILWDAFPEKAEVAFCFPHMFNTVDTCFRLTLILSCPNCESAFLPRVLASFAEGRCLETKLWELGVCIATVVTLLLDFSVV